MEGLISYNILAPKVLRQASSLAFNCFKLTKFLIILIKSSKALGVKIFFSNSIH